MSKSILIFDELRMWRRKWLNYIKINYSFACWLIITNYFYACHIQDYKKHSEEKNNSFQGYLINTISSIRRMTYIVRQLKSWLKDRKIALCRGIDNISLCSNRIDIYVHIETAIPKTYICISELHLETNALVSIFSR